MTTDARTEYRRRIQQRQTIVFGTIGIVMSVLLLLGTLVWTGIIPLPGKGFHTLDDGTTNATIPCPASDAQPTPAESLTVRVYNSSNRTGLAGQVSGKLAERGVTVTDTTNWNGEPLNSSVRLYAGPDGITNAYTLRGFFPDANIELDTTNSSEVVDIVLGADYQEMNSNPTRDDFASAMTPLSDCQ
ncbi:MAG: LytR C-terminal domain-containing protein [Trueperella sp.]|nr:LytR C-terminal domain-containing protein [Trueperella sp.]